MRLIWGVSGEVFLCGVLWGRPFGVILARDSPAKHTTNHTQRRFADSERTPWRAPGERGHWGYPQQARRAPGRIIEVGDAC